MHLTIGICGQVSSGKTSLVNAFCGGFVGSSALHRETFSPESFYLDVSGSMKEFDRLAAELSKLRANNALIRAEAKPIDLKILERNSLSNPLPSYHGFSFRLIDFPGINDASDSEGKFLKVLFDNLELCDIIIYVTNAETALTLTSEINIIEQIKAKMAEISARGIYCELIVVVNKYDNLFDKELKTIFETAREKLKLKGRVFRVSSHKLLIKTLQTNKISYAPPKAVLEEFKKILKTSNISITPKLVTLIKDAGAIEFGKLTHNIDIDAEDSATDNYSGDWDGLIDFLTSINLSSKKFEHIRDYIRERVAQIPADESQLQCIWKIWPYIIQFAPTREPELLNDLKKALAALKTKELFINILGVTESISLCSKLISVCFSHFSEYENLCYLVAFHFINMMADYPETILNLLAQKRTWQPPSISYLEYETAQTITLSEPNWLIKKIESSANSFASNMVMLAQQPYHKLKYMQDKIDYAKILPANLYESLKFRLSDWDIFMLNEDISAIGNHSELLRFTLRHLLFIDIRTKCTFELHTPRDF